MPRVPQALCAIYLGTTCSIGVGVIPKIIERDDLRLRRAVTPSGGNRTNTRKLLGLLLNSPEIHRLLHPQPRLGRGIEQLSQARRHLRAERALLVQ